MEYDFLIVGGGSAGSILARRIADAKIGSVCLIEVGASDEEDQTMMDLRRVLEQSENLDWGFKASRLLNGAPDLQYLRAKTLGGCGNHNDCAWVVPPDLDFELWEEMGATGWSPSSLTSFFDKLHQKISVEECAKPHQVTKKFIESAVVLGHERIDVTREFRQGVSIMPLNASNYKRISSTVAYLHPLNNLPSNLHLLTQTMVKGLLFDNRHVVGCQTSRGNVIAREEVILAAGSIGTPHLLMTSGIGNPKDLQDVGVKIRQSLGGVGQNLCDHFSASVIFDLPREYASWSITPYEALMFLNTSGMDLRPDCLVQFALKSGFVGKDGKAPYAKRPVNAIDLAPNVMRPASRGRLRINSADIYDAPQIDLQYFSDSEGSDIKIIRNALRYCQRIGHTEKMRNMGAVERQPGPIADSDNELDAFIRENCESVNHACGTCRIGAVDDPLAVVGPDLCVIGVTGLRICDASIFPTIVSVNINSTVMAIAEKGANLVISEKLASSELKSGRSHQPLCKNYQGISTKRTGIVVDAYSTGRFLAKEFSKYNIELSHVQSMSEILEFDKPYFQMEDFASKFVYRENLEKLLTAISKIQPSFVIAGSESGVILADRLAEKFGLPGNGTALSLARRDKDEMANILSTAGLRCIRHIATNSFQEACAWCSQQHIGEMVVKPINSAGTEDLYFCNSEKELKSAMGKILGKINAMGELNDRALVQERIIGRQFTINTISSCGRHYLSEAWTYNTVEVSGFGSLCQYEELLDGNDSQVIDLKPYVFNVLNAFAIKEGPAHLELFIDRKGAVLIELGARMQGSMSRSATTQVT